jgi:hypothetical protein
MEYYPSGFMEKVGNIWRAGGRRARLDLKNFARFITIQAEATGSWRGEIRGGEVVSQPDEGDGEAAPQRAETSEPADQADEIDGQEAPEPQGDEQEEPARTGG